MKEKGDYSVNFFRTRDQTPYPYSQSWILLSAQVTIKSYQWGYLGDSLLSGEPISLSPSGAPPRRACALFLPQTNK